MMFDNSEIKMNWRDIAIHDDKNIYGFFGNFRWLSNFHPCVTVEGYPTVENGYMASKVKARFRPQFKTFSAYDAKARWNEFPLIDKCAGDWDNRKVEVMRYFLEQKFDKVLNPDLWKKLQDTGNKQLVELNFWGDIFWGVDYKRGGQNMLGKLLMEIRSES